MDIKEKIEYLSQYIKAKRRYDRLDTQLKSAGTFAYDEVKSTIHKSLAERIHDRDIAHKDMMKAYIEVDSLIGDDIILGYLFILCYPIDDIAKTLKMTKKDVRKQFFKSLRNVNI